MDFEDVILPSVNFPPDMALQRRSRSASSEQSTPILSFPASSYSVDGCLAGPAYGVPISAYGPVALSASELRFSLSPPIMGLPVVIVLPITDIVPGSLKLCEPLFSARHITGVVRKEQATARFRVDVVKCGGTEELFKELEKVVTEAAEEARLSRARADAAHTGPFVKTGKHFALVDPHAPACFHLTDQVEPA